MELADAFAQVVEHGLEATGLDAKEIECGHVGNFVGDLFAGQGLLGGFFGLVHPDFDGMPTARHEAACASGSVAILAAAAEIEAGRYDLACVLGIEQMRNVSGQQAADNLGAAAWAGHEYLDAKFPWPKAFSDLTDEYERRYGIDPKHLMRISEINFANGKKNPNAQTRQWAFTDKSFTADDEANPVVEGRTRKMDCGQVTDGAAVIFLASPRRAAPSTPPSAASRWTACPGSRAGVTARRRSATTPRSRPARTSAYRLSRRSAARWRTPAAAPGVE